MTLPLPSVFAAIMGLGAQELIIILIIVMLLFGAKKLPDLARGMGKSIREFKKASNEAADDDDEAESVANAEAPKNGAKATKVDTTAKN
jgi:sec-independent protein translocase protein TatA